VGLRARRSLRAFAVPLVALALGWIAWLWRARQQKGLLGARGPDLSDRADVLAEAVRTQWEQAAGERGLLAPEPIPVRWARPVLPLAGPAAAAVAARRFDPLPGLSFATSIQSDTGQISELHALYGGLGSGRLIIAGAPGAGKSGTAVLLVLAALRYRDQATEADRQKIPVPVLFTAHDWSEPVQDWLAGKMRQTYSLFVGTAGAADAAALVAAGKVSLILDGLDEMAEELRPAALQALSQSPFRVIVLSRTAEMASAASRDGLLEGAAAIELCPIDPGTAASYLSRTQLDPPPPGWRDLIDRILSPHTSLAEALNNPLALTLVKDTYRAGEDIRELLDFCDTAQQHAHGSDLALDITDHLLDRVIPVAYTPRPGRKPPAYDLQTAQNALAHIAARMNQEESRDLQWWNLPEWTPAAPRKLTIAAVYGFVVGLGFGLVLGFRFGVGLGLVAGLACGAIAGFGGGLTNDRGYPMKLGKLQSRALFRKNNLVVGLVVGLGAGLVVGLGAGAGFGLGLWLVIFVGAGIMSALDNNVFNDPNDTSSISPISSWRNNAHYALVVALVAGLAFGATGGLMGGLIGGVGVGVGLGLVAGIGFGIVYGFGSGELTVTLLLVAVQLHRRWQTPVRLMRFLDDAREQSVLRTVGSVYQFRHARLQDRLAKQFNKAIDSSNDRNNSVRQANHTSQ
jgi:hypothetical protein